MAIPQFGKTYKLQDDLGNLTNLGILPSEDFDPRLQSQEIGEILFGEYSEYLQNNEPISTYSVTKTVRNLDINTQRFTYEINVDMAIAATVPAPEPVEDPVV